MKKENTSTRLNALMEERDLRQIDILALTSPFCKKYNVKMNKSDISQYVSGKVEPSQDKLVILGMALNVSESWLMGFDVPRSRGGDNNYSDLSAPERKLLDNYRSLNPEGQGKASDYLEDLVASGRYTVADNLSVLGDGPISIAAHERTDIEVTDEMREHDMKIMLDDDF